MTSDNAPGSATAPAPVRLRYRSGSQRGARLHRSSDADHLSPVEQFIRRWQPSGSAEHANYQMFLSELCTDVLGVAPPEPSVPDDARNGYVFERNVRFQDGGGATSTGRIDLYKRGCFVLETKQGVAAESDASLFAVARPARRGHGVRGSPSWDAAMEAARGQAENYVRALPPAEGNPPFVVVVDVGHTIELYADFSRLGKTYTPFPDPLTHRIKLTDLADEAVRARLAKVWTDPLSLDPSRHSAKVTRKVAEKLAKLAKSLEASGHHAETVAHFLMRCLFTFFAEDARLIEREKAEEQPFTQLLKDLKGKPDQFVPMVQDVWARMDAGGFSPALRRKLKHFNGKLFKEHHVIPLNAAQLDLLIEAGNSDWSDVEPAIFGTLLERALDERERHKLGAHYTPRAYVERLVLPTVIEPLREQFDAAKAAAFTLNFQGKPEDARKAIHGFLARLCSTTVLDPACGSGNFLYVTMEHMKRLEGEARDLLRQLGEQQEVLERGGLTVDPHQFLGLEINPRAVAIAELVLWIGYLKWHLRTLGHAPNEPLLRDFHNIIEQDAVLAYDKKELLLDEQGKPVSRWDGRTLKRSPVTGEEVPDETARVPVYRYINPRKAEWPKADYAVGNPPYIGNKRMREVFDDGYVDAVRDVNAVVPGSSDYVMYWWAEAAELISSGSLKRAGLITTNTITQAYNRQVLEDFIDSDKPVSLAFAITEHPWVDATDGAAVRVAMTVLQAGKAEGRRLEIVQEIADGSDAVQLVVSEERGVINSDTSIGTRVTAVESLRANQRLCAQGVKLVGDGFIVDNADYGSFRSDLAVVRPYLSGRDLVQKPRDAYVIDLAGLDEREAREQYPAAFQRVLDTVRPFRMQNRDAGRKKRWWLFGRSNERLRASLNGLKRYIVTPEVAKYRPFAFASAGTVPDASLYAVASDDAYTLGVLSSHVHVTWALYAGGLLEDRPRYQNGSCFEPFPFPSCADVQKQTIRELGEALDAHRKRQQAAHPGLTITDMYNVLEKLRSGAELTAKDKRVHEQGLVSVLKQIHDDLDAAVAKAYGWPADLTDEEILQRLVALNAERAAEERRGVVRWLRPEFQNPGGTSTGSVQGELPIDAKPAAATAKAAKLAWPKTLPEQAQAVRAALASRAAPASAEELAKAFKGAKLDRVRDLLETLGALGQVRRLNGERFAA